MTPTPTVTRRRTAGLAAAFLAAAALGAAGAAWAAPPETRELPGQLRAAPQLPVSPLNRLLPDHRRALDRARENGHRGGCDKDIDLTSTISGAVAVAAQDNGICTSADIDVYLDGGATFAVQGGATEAAFIITDVSNPAAPLLHGPFSFSGRAGRGTTVPDVKAFRQGTSAYVALALERTRVTGACGVVIVNVDDPAAPVILSQFIGADWCDTHNVFVEDDVNGDGAYIYATADATADLRVLAVNDPALGATVTTPVEVGTYRRTDRNPPNDADVYNDAYVHDVTVANGLVYAAYWNKGLDILDADLIRQAGITGLLVDETSALNVRPPDFAANTPFLAHHAFPSADGSLVFVEDEITFDVDANGNPVSGVEPVQMWTTAGVPARVDGLLIDDLVGDVPVLPAHNLEISALQPNRLYVGWYKAGLQGWDFDATGFVRPNLEPRTAAVYHQAQTEAADDPYSGAWGVRFAQIGGVLYGFQSDRSFGLIVDCLGDGAGDLSACP